MQLLWEEWGLEEMSSASEQDSAGGQNKSEMSSLSEITWDIM